jgi:hypothetical protein
VRSKRCVSLAFSMRFNASSCAFSGVSIALEICVRLFVRTDDCWRMRRRELSPTHGWVAVESAPSAMTCRTHVRRARDYEVEVSRRTCVVITFKTRACDGGLKSVSARRRETRCVGEKGCAARFIVPNNYRCVFVYEVRSAFELKKTCGCT